MPRHATRKSNKAASKANGSKQTDEISEADQWRIIEQSGILKKVPQESRNEPRSNSASDEEAEEESSVLCDEIFNTALLLIPMASILLLMEM